MLPANIQQLWENYLAAERVRVREQSLVALDRFIAELLRLPSEMWFSWGRQLASRAIDEHEDIPIRLPLSRSVVFPTLEPIPVGT